MKKILLAALLLAQAASAQVYNYFAPGGALSGTATVQSINLAASGYLTGQLPISFLATGSWPGNAATATLATTASALASTPSLCSLPNVALGILANGNASCAQPSNTTGNAATATALAAVPAQCSGGQFSTGVAANGTANCSSLPTYPSGANPSASLGLSAVNGVATTFMRSDAAPALSQSIAPTMTGNWTFTPASLIPITVNAPSAETGIQINGGSDAYAETIIGSSVASNSYGLLVFAGTNSADYGLNVFNQTGTTTYFGVRGDGGITVGTPTGGDQGIGTINAQGLYVNGTAVVLPSGNVATATALATTPTQCSSSQFATGIAASGNANCSSTLGGNQVATATSGSFVGTYTGYSSAATANIYYSVVGSTCTLVLEQPSFTTSNATTLTMTGIPSACQPVRQQYVAIPDGTMQDNGGTVYAFNSKGASASISGSTITFNLNNSASGWTNANAKGVAANIAVTYLLN